MLKKRIIIGLIGVLLFLLGYDIIPVFVFANSDNESLYVDTYNAVTEEWVKVGNSPYLDTQNQPTDYGYVSVKNELWEEFTYSDLSVSPDSITSVIFYFYADCGSEKIRVSIWDSGASAYVLVTDFSGSGWNWQNFDISTILTTETEINNAKVKFESKAQAKWSGSVSIDCSYLYIDYFILPKLVHARYTFSPSNPTSTETISFDATYTEGATSYSWDFGDSTNDTGLTTTHAYLSTGDYNITLTASNGDGNEDTFTQIIMVEDVVRVYPVIPIIPEPILILGACNISKTFVYTLFFGETCSLDITISNPATTNKTCSLEYWIQPTTNANKKWSDTQLFFVPASLTINVTLKYPISQGGNHILGYRITSPNESEAFECIVNIESNVKKMVAVIVVAIVFIILIIVLLSVSGKKEDKRRRI